MSSHVQKRRDQLRALYGFDFPEDLFRFWEFARRLRPLEPLNVLYETLGIALTGPFEVLEGRFDGRTPHYSLLLHWRYFLDPPEFFTLLAGGDFGHHWGYVLDDPGESAPPLVASNWAEDSFEMDLDGEGLFAAVRLEIEEQAGQCQENMELAPDEEEEWSDQLSRLDQLRDRLIKYETGDRTETSDEYIVKYKPLGEQTRRRRAIADTPDGLGIVVSAESYRPPKLNDKSLRRRLQGEKDISAVVRAAQRAVLEGFPGTALKLGKELWVAGPSYAADAFDLLDAAYAALGRAVLRAVVREHRTHRDRPWLDVLQEE